MVQGPEVLFLVGAAASEDSFEGEDYLNTLGLSFLEPEAKLNAMLLYGVFSNPCCVGQA